MIPPALSVGDLVEFPAAVSPWRSGVLRNRTLTIHRGARAEVMARPYLVGQRGYMVEVRISRDYVTSSVSRPEDLNPQLRLRVKVSEVLAVSPGSLAAGIASGLRAIAADVEDAVKLGPDAERRLARVTVEQAEIALRNATGPYERSVRAYREAELALSRARLAEAEVLDRLALATGPGPGQSPD